MANRNDQTLQENGLLTLNDKCAMRIFELLPLLDYANLANTYRSLEAVVRDFSTRYHKKIEIHTSYMASGSKLFSKREFLQVMSVIGEHVLEVEIYTTDSLMLQSVKDKCKNLQSISIFCNHGPQVLQCFRNLKQLKVYSGYVNLNEWRNFFASNSELEVLHNEYFYEDGFIELLTHLPKLRSLGLPVFVGAEFELFRLTGLTKLSLESSYNLNEILVVLAQSMNLMELEISMQFDGESIGVIKSFQNLEVLSIVPRGTWNETLFSNATFYPSKLQRLKMKKIRISCSRFLKIVQYLTLLNEFELTEIVWEDECKLIRFPL